MAVNLIAFLWGFAEATLFFIIPDVGLSIIAMKGADIGIIACCYALAGALVGGTIMYYWGQANIKAVTHVLERIPAIRHADILKVKADLEKSGIKAVFWGPIFGIPYKIYAAHAHLITSIFMFLLISVPARMIRFILVSLVTPYVMEKVIPSASHSAKIQAMLFLWVVIYAIYFFLKRK
jgi:membrane protein YqaA with SNARE-associated domain